MTMMEHNAVQSVWTVGVVLARQPSRPARRHDLMKITQFDYEQEYGDEQSDDDDDGDDKNTNDFDNETNRPTS